MKTWFSADYHLNHANIIRYCRRPFKSVEEMNSTIINNHNSRVDDNDIVFFIGDFLFRNSSGGKEGEGLPDKAEHFIKQLKGRLHFIKGNHDNNNSLKTSIESIYIRHGGHKICLVHNPFHSDPSCTINLVGHIHNQWKIKRLNKKSVMINVGVDVFDFKPVTFEEINKRLQDWLRKESTP